MIRRVVPTAGGELDEDAVGARQTLLDWYSPHDREYVRLNLVATLDGRAAGADGTSESLTTRVDRMILGAIRQHADVVLVGAQTVRREGYVRPRRAALAIVTASGDLTGHRLDEPPADHKTASGPPPVFVVTTEKGAKAAAHSAPGARLLILPGRADGHLEPAAVVAQLRDAGLPGIVAEGGPSFAAQLLGASLVDELCLTVMPTLGGPALPLLGSNAVSISMVSAHQLLLSDDGAQFGRWMLNQGLHPRRVSRPQPLNTT